MKRIKTVEEAHEAFLKILQQCHAELLTPTKIIPEFVDIESAESMVRGLIDGEEGRFKDYNEAVIDKDDYMKHLDGAVKTFKDTFKDTRLADFLGEDLRSYDEIGLDDLNAFCESYLHPRYPGLFGAAGARDASDDYAKGEGKDDASSKYKP